MGVLKSSTVWLAVLFIMGGASGCSPGKHGSDAAAPPPPAKTVFDPLTQQLGRARDVQKTVNENTDAAAKAVDDQERGDSPP